MLSIEDQELERIATSMQAISSPVRLKIVCLLDKGERSVNEILASVGTGQSNISQHLSILSRRGILTSRREAHFIYYRLSDQRMPKLIKLIHQVFCSKKSRQP